MEIEILVFGVAKDIVGNNLVKLKINDTCDVSTLKNTLKDKFPKLPDFMIAINTNYAEDDQQINKNDEIALIPPTNGG